MFSEFAGFNGEPHKIQAATEFFSILGVPFLSGVKTKGRTNHSFYTGTNLFVGGGFPPAWGWGLGLFSLNTREAERKQNVMCLPRVCKGK